MENIEEKRPTLKFAREVIKKSVAIDPILSVVLLCSIALLLVSIFIQAKNTRDISFILEESIKKQLLSTAVVAREVIDVDKFISYNSVEDIIMDSIDFKHKLEALRDIAHSSGAAYIYAVKKVNGKPVFIFDTDEEDETFFEEYEDIAQVHERAFKGEDAVGIMNVQDEWGNFSTSAIPIYNGRNVVGIISVDIADSYIIKTKQVLLRNSILQIIMIVAVLLAMIIIIARLVKKVIETQAQLRRIAHYDTITNLPNRQYLMDYLNKKTSKEKGEPFAVLFIDLDNFKKVNDNAGHDAGDALLKRIGDYLQKSAISRTPVSENTIVLTAKAISFRIAPGMLNIAARIGGDEFIHVVRDIETEEEAKEVAIRLLEGFDELRKNDEIIQTYGVGLSVGIALYPKHSENYHVLIKYADIAMYKAKKSGKNNYAVYSLGMDSGEKECNI